MINGWVVDAANISGEWFVIREIDRQTDRQTDRQRGIEMIMETEKHLQKMSFFSPSETSKSSKNNLPQLVTPGGIVIKLFTAVVIS